MWGPSQLPSSSFGASGSAYSGKTGSMSTCAQTPFRPVTCLADFGRSLRRTKDCRASYSIMQP